MDEPIPAAFVTGGPVRYDSPVYVTREKETTVFNKIRARKYVTVVGSRQIGKTSLLQRIQAICEQQYGYACALVDLSTLNSDRVDASEWSHRFCERIHDQLEPFLPAGVDLPQPETGPQYRQYWESLANQARTPTVLILIDEASALPANIGDSFYSVIRWIFTDRTSYRPVKALQKLTFCFAGVFDPDKLIQDRQNSPFNVSTVVRLPDFSWTETENLLVSLNKIRPGAVSRETVGTVFELTGGHPYLTQWMAALLADQMVESPHLRLDQRAVMALQPLLQESAEDNIAHVISLSTETEAYRGVLRRLLAGEQLQFSRGKAEISRLELIGAIRPGDDGLCYLRNKVYENALNKALGDGAPVPLTPNRPRLGPQLSPDQNKQICEALRSAFNRQELERVLQYTLGQDLDAITQAPDYATTVFDLVAWAVRRNKVNDLVLGALQDNPNNAALQHLDKCYQLVDPEK